MPSLLVLGAGGYIGREVVAALRETRRFDVISGFRHGVPATSGPSVSLDLAAASTARVGAMLRDLAPEIIVDCLGRIEGSDTMLVRDNVVALARLSDAVAQVVPGVRIVHLGSAAEYGPGPAGSPVTESRPAAPLTSYGAAKLLAGQLLMELGRRGAADVVNLRVFNPVGPGMAAGTLPGAAVGEILRARRAHDDASFGSLEAVRDFVDVRDVGRAVAAACSAALPLPMTLNIGSGEGHTARQLVTALAHHLGFEGRIREDRPGSPRSERVPWQVADISLARQALGWRPVCDFEATCAHAAAPALEPTEAGAAVSDGRAARPRPEGLPGAPPSPGRRAGPR